MNEAASPQNSLPLLSEEYEENSKPKLSRNNHFKAAYVNCDNEFRSTAIVRGRKTFAFWIMVILLLLLTIGNCLITLTVVGVLKIGNGMQSMEYLPDEKSIKLFGDVDLGRIYKQNGLLQGFAEENVEITAENDKVHINLYSKPSRMFPKLILEKNDTSFNGISSFKVTNKEKEIVLDVARPLFGNLKNVNALKSKSLSTNKVKSKIDDNLKIEADSSIHLKGNEGAKIEAREIIWTTEQDIFLKSVNGSIVLSAEEGISINVDRLPLAKTTKSIYVTAQFKICVCMPQGKLFRVPLVNARDQVYCHQVDMSPEFNPCI
ncbi:hypothetical protein ABEB36_004901 [Hypothenemus hampei]|uniref:Beta-sarcoglycan n=1 Tax=Hypothenemus hampei TaxID=57062 RepID=A0ABD1EWA7_HYPHA